MPELDPRPVPLPPGALMERTGALGPAPGAEERYLAIGASLRAMILDALPEDIELSGGRILDFGCGAGRVLRHFLPDADATELHGTDVDAASIAWLQEHLGHAATAQVTSEIPGLPYPDGHFDVVYAMSVFTHLTEHWAGWLLECHRVLKPGGVLVATTLGAGMSEPVLHEPWRGDRIGLHVSSAGVPWDEGGPIAFCSPWWVRAHWGRAFDVLAPAGEPPLSPGAHDVWTLRRREVALDVAALEAWEPDEPREAEAIRHNLWNLWRELAGERDRLRDRHRAALADHDHLAGVVTRLQAELDSWQDVAREWESRADRWQERAGVLEHESAAHAARADALRAEATARAAAELDGAELRRRYDVIVASSSWRLTAPLRRLAARVRRRP